MVEHQGEKAARGHHLVVTKSSDWTEDEPDWDWTIVCVAPERCGCWQECGESHEVEGEPENEGPWDSDESAPWYERDEYVFHGVVHEWQGFGHGWTVTFQGCGVAANDWAGDSAAEIAHEYGEGVHVVDDDWDDTDLNLIYVETLPSIPLAPTTEES